MSSSVTTANRSTVSISNSSHGRGDDATEEEVDVQEYMSDPPDDVINRSRHVKIVEKRVEIEIWTYKWDVFYREACPLPSEQERPITETAATRTPLTEHRGAGMPNQASVIDGNHLRQTKSSSSAMSTSPTKSTVGSTNVRLPKLSTTGSTGTINSPRQSTVSGKSQKHSTTSLKLPKINDQRKRRGLETMKSQEKKPPIVLLHGYKFTSWLWEDNGVLPLLAAMGHRVLAVDLPGHGDTVGPAIDKKHKGEFLARFIHRTLLNTSLPVLVSPPTAETFALPYLLGLARRADPRVYGAVLVHPGWPVTLKDVKPLSTDIPALLVHSDASYQPWVAAAGRLRAALPGAPRLLVAGGKHLEYPAYWRAPTVLYHYIRKLDF